MVAHGGAAALSSEKRWRPQKPDSAGKLALLADASPKTIQDCKNRNVKFASLQEAFVRRVQGIIEIKPVQM